MAQVQGDWLPGSVRQRLPAVLRAHPDVDLISAHNDPMGRAARQVAQAQGLGPHVRIIGVDGLPGPGNGLQLVEDGALNATLLYPTGGEEAIRTALRILAHQPYEKENVLVTIVVDSTNVGPMRTQTEQLAVQRRDLGQQQRRLQAQQRRYASQETTGYLLGASLLGAVLLGALAWRSSRVNRRIRRTLEGQNAEIRAQRNQIDALAEEARRAAEAKMCFFTNFSHELPTPLTLIQGPVDDLLTSPVGLSPPSATTCSWCAATPSCWISARLTWAKWPCAPPRATWWPSCASWRTGLRKRRGGAASRSGFARRTGCHALVAAALKGDWRTSHIPLVLLTARDAPEQQVAGVQAGADLYLTKPFNPTFLIESLRTLLRNRGQQREHFRRELSVTTATVAPQRVDQKFLADLTAAIEARLDQPALSVDDLARHLGVSQMQLYRKVKAMLGTGVTDYIQGLRLTKARQLLLAEGSTIAGVAYQTGFSSPYYFSTAFKGKYQVSPSEYRALHAPARP
ncbi:hypothetical protein BEN49_17345 [Hymenobacter coccineus]|uniref:HTH araC/xylS-type domain-containing protein n=2 Tax=Hymenobacter coccineus TaxID=1908235 RepID=A0A1G1TME8_9BACT|nr:hypothetical protein BEN49_17345 [Hymenobacter coccineus]